jgi:hypothetical protein
MRRVKVVLAAAMAISLAGCFLSGKPKTPPATPATPRPTPATPPEPLSIPQTQVTLPPPQAVNPDALRTAPPVEQPAPREAAAPAVTPQRPSAPRNPPQVQAKPPETPAEPEPSRPPIQEILPAEEQRRLQHEAQDRRNQTGALVEAAARRGLSPRERRRVEDINQFVKQSEQAEKNGDMRSADLFAERALILARELQGGK